MTYEEIILSNHLLQDTNISRLKLWKTIEEDKIFKNKKEQMIFNNLYFHENMHVKVTKSKNPKAPKVSA